MSKRKTRNVVDESDLFCPVHDLHVEFTERTNKVKGGKKTSGGKYFKCPKYYECKYYVTLQPPHRCPVMT
ncbi:MAG: hypothetical protein ACW987_19360 [Candidatus Thorarchaeota archaeon]|jgi:hypothetical protein